MQKNMQVCDLCNRVSDKMTKKVIIDDVSYDEVCESCIGKLKTFSRNLAIRKISNYKKKKKDLDEKNRDENKEPTNGATSGGLEPANESIKPRGILGRR